MRVLKRISGLVLSLCLAGTIALPAMAAQKESYTYQVRFLAGAQGAFNPDGNLSNNGTQSPTLESGECLVFDNLMPGARVSFHNGMITLKDSGKYYIRGIRESGKDNNTVYYTTFTVEGDKDYVIAYGILGDAVAYTVNYEDESGNSLAPSETYYGNVGDRPVVSYLYFEGYQPQAYNLIGRLSENAAENVFTFVYRRVRAGETVTVPGTTTTTTTTTVVNEGTVTPGEGGAGLAAPGDAAAGAVAPGAAAPGAAAPGAAGPEAPAPAAPGPAAPDADTPPVEDIQDEDVPLGPADIASIDDEEVPLADGDTISNGKSGNFDFAKLIGIPVPAKVGILSGLALLTGFGVWFFVFRKRKKEKDA